MRRFHDRQPAGLFRGSELPRLLTMLGMLLVLAALINRARDVDTWRYFTGETRPTTELADAEDVSDSSPVVPAQKPPEQTAPAASGDHPDSDAPPAAQPVEAEPPLDEDPEQRTAFEEEAQALTDRAPLTREEMWAYWRLFGWANAAKLSDLTKRAHTVRYGDLILEPAEHRGELIKVKLHLLQNRKEQAPPDNTAGVSTYYQAVGWNESSQAWFYFCVYADLPSGMPVGDRIEELGTFVGYFLKTVTYQDGQGKTIQAPILIGRMIWHPVAHSKQPGDSWDPIWLIAGGIGAILFTARYLLLWFLPSRRKTSLAGILQSRSPSGEPTESVESWLDRVESEADSDAINHPGKHESNGNPPGQSLDRSDNHEG